MESNLGNQQERAIERLLSKRASNDIEKALHLPAAFQTGLQTSLSFPPSGLSLLEEVDPFDDHIAKGVRGR